MVFGGAYPCGDRMYGRVFILELIVFDCNVELLIVTGGVYPRGDEMNGTVFIILECIVLN